jgi:hypothetical protein
MALLCPDCCKKFLESKGFGTHKSYCKDLQDLDSWPKRYNDDNGESSNPKRARSHIDPGDYMSVDEHASDWGDNAQSELLPEPLLVPQTPLSPVSVSFSGCKQKVPHTLRDYVPHSLAGLPLYLHPVPPNPTPTEILAASPLPPPNPMPEPDILRTDPNGFGLH